MKNIRFWIEWVGRVFITALLLVLYYNAIGHMHIMLVVVGIVLFLWCLNATKEIDKNAN